jgi:nitrogen fixation NifU-like protein
VTAFRAVVLEHFRHPRNRRSVERATASIEGANPLCGDRIRVEVRVEDDVVADAAFTADACAICIASASMLTEHARGLPLAAANGIDVGWLHDALEGQPPPARARCVTLPLDTFRRALAESTRR